MFRCPECHDEESFLSIQAKILMTIEVDPDESVTESDYKDLEWTDADTAQCSCGWIGTVLDMTVAEPDEDELPTE